VAFLSLDHNHKERHMALMCRKVCGRTLVAVGLWGSLWGLATAQETGAAALVVPRFGPGAAGNFLVSVPVGAYLVHVETGRFPRGDEGKVMVDTKAFAFVALDCDSGLR